MLYGRFATMRVGLSRDRSGRRERERVAGDDLQATGIGSRDFPKRLDAAFVALDRDHALCSVRKQRSRETARTRSHFDDGNALERSRRARDPAGEIEIEQEVLAERLARRQAVPADHLAQRREFVDLAHFAVAGTFACASRCARLSAASRLDGFALPVPARSNAVP